MVNTGKPSQGCATCKQRRIRCDLERPECKRCKTTGRSCPGVPLEGATSFIDQNDYAVTVKRKAKRAVKAAIQIPERAGNTR